MFALNIRLLDFWFSVLQNFRTCSFFFWSLCCLFFFDLRIQITTVGIFKLFYFQEIKPNIVTTKCFVLKILITTIK